MREFPNGFSTPTPDASAPVNSLAQRRLIIDQFVPHEAAVYEAPAATPSTVLTSETGVPVAKEKSEVNMTADTATSLKNEPLSTTITPAIHPNAETLRTEYDTYGNFKDY